MNSHALYMCWKLNKHQLILSICPFILYICTLSCYCCFIFKKLASKFNCLAFWRTHAWKCYLTLVFSIIWLDGQQQPAMKVHHFKPDAVRQLKRLHFMSFPSLRNKEKKKIREKEGAAASMSSWFHFIILKCACCCWWKQNAENRRGKTAYSTNQAILFHLKTFD